MSGLSGKRVVVTRAATQAAELAGRLRARGATPILFPTILIASQDDYDCLDRALQQLARYNWIIFTSANAVAAFWKRLRALGLDSAALSGRRMAAIGPATARALQAHGVAAELVPDEYRAEAVVDGLGDVERQWILWPRAEVAREALADELGRRGAVVHEIAVYRTLPVSPDPGALDELRRGVDVLTFASSSAVRNFVELLGARDAALLRHLTAAAAVACIGPITAQTAREHGLPVTIQAETHTMDGLVGAIAAYYARFAG